MVSVQNILEIVSTNDTEKMFYLIVKKYECLKHNLKLREYYTCEDSL